MELLNVNHLLVQDKLMGLLAPLNFQLFMKKYIYFLFFILSFFFKAQIKIEGIVKDIKDGQVEIFSTVENENLKGFSNISYKNEIVDGKFFLNINGLGSTPQSVFIRLTSKELNTLTEKFYIDKESKTIKIILDNNERYPTVEIFPFNKNQTDFLKKKKHFALIETQWKNYDNFVQKKISNNKKLNDQDKKEIDSVRSSIIKKEFEITQSFIINQPNSYIALWELYKLLDLTSSKEKKFEQLFHNFNTELKQSALGFIILEKLKSISENKLHNYKLKNIKNEIINFNDIRLSKYTLVDFWFSYCKPCLEEMPRHKKIYDKYREKGFEYIGISTDKKQDVSNWIDTIEKKGLIWKNFLDENGKEAKENNINKFPTTFLIDFEGKIIKKDISSEELEIFLKENLK